MNNSLPLPLLRDSSLTSMQMLWPSPFHFPMPPPPGRLEMCRDDKTLQQRSQPKSFALLQFVLIAFFHFTSIHCHRSHLAPTLSLSLSPYPHLSLPTPLFRTHTSASCAAELTVTAFVLLLSLCNQGVSRVFWTKDAWF